MAIIMRVLTSTELIGLGEIKQAMEKAEEAPELAGTTQMALGAEEAPKPNKGKKVDNK